MTDIAIGKHGFSGNCAPREGESSSLMSTFSLGIYQIVPKAGSSGSKRSPVKVRVSGSMGYSGKVYAKAREIVAQLDAGTYKGPKRVVV